MLALPGCAGIFLPSWSPFAGPDSWRRIGGIIFVAAAVLLAIYLVVAKPNTKDDD